MCVTDRARACGPLRRTRTGGRRRRRRWRRPARGSAAATVVAARRRDPRPRGARGRGEMRTRQTVKSMHSNFERRGPLSLRHRERVTVRRADETRHRHDERQSGATVTSDARGAKGSGESEQRQTQGTGDVQSLSSAETTAGAHVGHDARRPRPLLAPFVPLTPCGADS